MPYTTKVNPNGGVDILKHGKKVGHSSSQKKADASIRARNAGAHGWRKPTATIVKGKKA